MIMRLGDLLAQHTKGWPVVWAIRLLELELVSDPESRELRQTLFGYIYTPLPVQDAVAKLDEFDETWFLDAVYKTGVSLNFNLRFYEL
jgi:hypothetical protein